MALIGDQPKLRSTKMTTSKIALVTLALLLSTGAGNASQTKEQCSAFSNAFGKMIPSAAELEKTMTDTNPSSILPQLGGPLLAATTIMSQKQRELVTAIQNYRRSVEDTVHEAQLCAR
jgi:hypothetical protein